MAEEIGDVEIHINWNDLPYGYENYISSFSMEQILPLLENKLEAPFKKVTQQDEIEIALDFNFNEEEFLKELEQKLSYYFDANFSSLADDEDQLRFENPDYKTQYFNFLQGHFDHNNKGVLNERVEMQFIKHQKTLKSEVSKKERVLFNAQKEQLNTQDYNFSNKTLSLLKLRDSTPFEIAYQKMILVQLINDLLLEILESIPIKFVNGALLSWLIDIFFKTPGIQEIFKDGAFIALNKEYHQKWSAFFERKGVKRQTNDQLLTYYSQILPHLNKEKQSNIPSSIKTVKNNFNNAKRNIVLNVFSELDKDLTSLQKWLKKDNIQHKFNQLSLALELEEQELINSLDNELLVLDSQLKQFNSKTDIENRASNNGRTGKFEIKNESLIDGKDLNNEDLKELENIYQSRLELWYKLLNETRIIKTAVYFDADFYDDLFTIVFNTKGLNNIRIHEFFNQKDVLAWKQFVLNQWKLFYDFAPYDLFKLNEEQQPSELSQEHRFYLNEVFKNVDLIFLSLIMSHYPRLWEEWQRENTLTEDAAFNIKKPLWELIKKELVEILETSYISNRKRTEKDDLSSKQKEPQLKELRLREYLQHFLNLNEEKEIINKSDLNLTEVHVADIQNFDHDLKIKLEALKSPIFYPFTWEQSLKKIPLELDNQELKVRGLGLFILFSVLTQSAKILQYWNPNTKQWNSNYTLAKAFKLLFLLAQSPKEAIQFQLLSHLVFEVRPNELSFNPDDYHLSLAELKTFKSLIHQYLDQYEPLKEDTHKAYFLNVLAEKEGVLKCKDGKLFLTVDLGPLNIWLEKGPQINQVYRFPWGTHIWFWNSH